LLPTHAHGLAVLLAVSSFGVLLFLLIAVLTELLYCQGSASMSCAASEHGQCARDELPTPRAA
jgi:hypothetical protein